MDVARGKYERWLTEDGLTLLEGWARDGLTDVQIAGNCGISTSTLYEWEKRFPKFLEAIKKGKEVVDYAVENALLKRALGYSYTETMVETGKDGTRHRETVKQVVPDVAAQIFWLKNRRPDRWRDKPEPAAERETEESGVVVLAPVGSPQGDPEPSLPPQAAMTRDRPLGQEGGC